MNSKKDVKQSQIEELNKNKRNKLEKLLGRQLSEAEYKKAIKLFGNILVN